MLTASHVVAGQPGDGGGGSVSVLGGTDAGGISLRLAVNVKLGEHGVGVGGGGQAESKSEELHVESKKWVSWKSVCARKSDPKDSVCSGAGLLKSILKPRIDGSEGMTER